MDLGLDGKRALVLASDTRPPPRALSRTLPRDKAQVMIAALRRARGDLELSPGNRRTLCMVSIMRPAMDRAALDALVA